MNIIVEEIETTDDAISIVNSTLDMIGELKSVEHRHVSKMYNYETTFIGSRGEILIKGGLSSGYRGTGSRGFEEVLRKLGFEQSNIEKYVYGTEKKFVLTK